MVVHNKFREFLELVTPLLKSYGFSRRGQNFYTRRDGNWGVINFQKSQSSTQDKVKFTVNLGIYSQVLAKFYERLKGSRADEQANDKSDAMHLSETAHFIK